MGDDNDNPALTELSGLVSSLTATVAELSAQIATLEQRAAQPDEGLVGELNKINGRLDSHAQQLVAAKQREERDGGKNLGDWQIRTERARIDELYRRLGQIGDDAAERRRVLMTHLGTGSTWSELISVGASLTTGGPRNSPPLHALSKRDGSYPLLEMPDSTYGTAYYLLDRTATVEITGTCTKPGTYTGTLRKSFSGFDSTDGSPLVIGDFGDAGDDCIVINGVELGKTTHDLVTGGINTNPYFGHIIGRDDGTELPLIGIHDGDLEDCPG